MTKFLPLIFTILITLATTGARGQDPFFSQFYNAPLTLNPALTGISYGNIQVTANYRNHLSTFDPFETYAFSLNASMLENKLNNDFGGLGILMVNDVSGIGLKNLKAMLSLAYHKSLGPSGNHFLALGFQGGIDQTNLDFGNLSTQSQWVDGRGIDQNLDNGERFTGDNTVLLDFQAGLMWYSFIGDHTTLFAGSSVYHITEPEKSITDENSKLSRRYVIHGGGKFGVGARVNIVPNLVFMQQSSSNVINTGLLLEYDLSVKNQNQIITAGAWLRNTSAVIINTGLEIKNFQIGLSYDLIISDIRTATNRGGVEIALTYNFRKSISTATRLLANPNPRL